MSEEKEIKLDANTVAMLLEMEVVFGRFGIEYYLVGALARDVQFQRRQLNMVFRKTDDVDLAVCINDEDHYNEVMDALVATGSFVRDEKEIIKLHYRLGIEVDLIPFGEIENEDREVRLTKPKAFTLQMPGFLEAFSFIEPVRNGDLTLHACPLEGIVMLKLISNNDRPGRTHDLTDIDNIIDYYFDLSADEIYSDHHDLFEVYDADDLEYYMPMISAHVIGRKMKILLDQNEALKERVISILAGNDDPRWMAMHRAVMGEA
jgi:predicted nucleotidyltransferase